MARRWAAAGCKIAAFQEKRKQSDSKSSHTTVWPKPGMKDLLVCKHFCGSLPHVSSTHATVFSAPPPPSHRRWSIAPLSLDVWCRWRSPGLSDAWDNFCWYLGSTFLLTVWAASPNFIAYYLISSWRYFLLPLHLEEPPSQSTLKQQFFQMIKTVKANKSSLSPGSRHISPKLSSTACWSSNVCEKLQKPQHK